MNSIKKNFPYFKAYPTITYLDNATTTHKPKSVIKSLIDFYTYCNASTYRSLYKHAENSTQLYESVRESCAQFIGAASANELAFTRGATDGINIVAQAWAAGAMAPGDEIVISELEHNSNILPWQRLAKERGYVLGWIKIDNKGVIITPLEEVITKATKLVCVTAYSNVLGNLNNLHKSAHNKNVGFVEALIARAHSVGAKVLLDATQLVPHQKINVQKMACDFLVFSGHKMLGPQGVGILYARSDMHDQFQPYQMGGGMVLDSGKSQVSYKPFPHLLEAGTQAVANIAAFGAALDYISNEIDFVWLREHENKLCAYLTQQIKRLERITLVGPERSHTFSDHLISFMVDGIHAHDVAAYLDAHNICVRAGNHCAGLVHKRLGISNSVRASFYVYNDLADVDTLVNGLKMLSNTLENKKI